VVFIFLYVDGLWPTTAFVTQLWTYQVVKIHWKKNYTIYLISYFSNFSCSGSQIISKCNALKQFFNPGLNFLTSGECFVNLHAKIFFRKISKKQFWFVSMTESACFELTWIYFIHLLRIFFLANQKYKTIQKFATKVITVSPITDCGDWTVEL